MKKEITQCVAAAMIASCLCLLTALVSQGEEKGDNNINITEAVFTSSQPISSGFVFVGGQYIEAPYVIYRKDLDIYINDIFIASYAPAVKEKSQVEEEASALPATNGSTNLVEYVSTICQRYVEGLEEGDFIRFTNDKTGAIYTFSPGAMKDELPAIVKLLRSSQDDETKAKQLRQMLKLPAMSKEDSKAFIANVAPSKQLDERVEALVKTDKQDQ